MTETLSDRSARRLDAAQLGYIQAESDHRISLCFTKSEGIKFNTLNIFALFNHYYCMNGDLVSCDVVVVRVVDTDVLDVDAVVLMVDIALEAEDDVVC